MVVRAPQRRLAPLGPPSPHAARCLTSANPRERDGSEGGCAFAYSELQCRRAYHEHNGSVVQCSRNFRCSNRVCRPIMPVLSPSLVLSNVNLTRLVFLGDSVVMQLECDFRRILATAGATYTCGSGGYEYFGPNGFRVSVKAVETGCPRRCRPSTKLAHRHLSSASHVIFNIGSHYDSSGRSLGEGRKKAPLRPALEEWVRTELRALKAAVVFLSQSMPHFATALGEYSPSLSPRRECTRQLPPTSLPRAEVLTRQAARNLTRLRELANGARPRGTAAAGAVLYVDVLGVSDQPWLHPGRGDCLHWCQECTMLHAWNSLISVAIAR